MCCTYACTVSWTHIQEVNFWTLQVPLLANGNPGRLGITALSFCKMYQEQQAAAARLRSTAPD